MRYLYYHLWQDFSGSKEENMPALYSMLLLSLIHNANLATMLVIFNHFYRIWPQNMQRNEIVTYSLFPSVGLMVIGYFLFYKKRNEIEEKYKNESKAKRRIGIILAYVYMIGSFVLVYVASQMFPVK